MISMKVGAARREIVIPEAYRGVEGFKAVHDPIHARALVIESGAMFALISLELTSLPGEEVEALRALVAERLGCARESVWICATHSFSSPHIMPDHMLGSDEAIALKNRYRENLQSAVAEAAWEAFLNRRAATFGWGDAECDIVANRDVELEEGWWVGTNGPGPADRTVTVLRFDDAEGGTIALVTHFAMQSSVMDQSEATGGGKIITSDVAGMTCAALEERFPGTVAIYLIGAAGDQAPVEKAVKETFINGEKSRTDIHEAGLDICARLAAKLADSAADACNGIVCASVEMDTASAKVIVPAKRMNGTVHSLRPTRRATYEADGEREMALDALRLGDLTLLGVQPELNCVTARGIAAGTRARTLVCTMVNGACKYMADEASYDTFRYEALNSPWARGAAEKLGEAGAKLINRLTERNEGYDH